MSSASISQLNEDVLGVIFQQLEGKDLLSCVLVCRQWRDILWAGILWKRIFQEKTKSSPFWRRAQKKLESDQLTLRMDQYQGVCKEVVQVKSNWRTGNFKTFAYLVNRGEFFRLTLGDDCAAWDYWPRVTPAT
jgi:hypothetical protein